MKVSTSKAPSVLKDLLAEKSRRLEMEWPGSETTVEVAAPAPTPIVAEQPEPTATVTVVVEEPAPSPATLIEEPVLEKPTRIAETPAAEIPAVPVIVVEPLIAIELPATPEPVKAIEPETPVAQNTVAEAMAEPVIEQAPAIEPAAAESQTQLPPTPRKSKAAKVEELLESDEWIRSLTQKLIDWEIESSRHGKGSREGAAAIKEIWNRLRPVATRDKQAARMEALSRKCAEERHAMASKDISDLKMRFLHSIRRVQEPYRSTLIYHYCEGLSVGEMVERLGIAGWIIRERLATALDQLDRILSEELGKEKTKRYVMLAHLGEN